MTIKKAVWLGVILSVFCLYSISIYADLLQDRIDVSVGNYPYDVAIGDSYVWVANSADHTVTRITKSDLSTTNVSVGSSPQHLDLDTNYVWVSNNWDDTVTRIDKSDLSTQDIEVGSNPRGIAVDNNYVWVANSLNNSVTRIKKSDLSTTEISVGIWPFGATVDDNYVWVTNSLSNTVTSIKKSDLSTDTISTGDTPENIAVDDDFAIVINYFDNEITKIDKSDLSTESIDIEDNLGSVAMNDAYVYIATGFNDSLLAFSKNGVYSQDFDAGSTSLGVDADNDYVWVTNYSDSSVSRFTVGELPEGQISGEESVWYLAEGCTDGFDQYVLIQNPNNVDVECAVTFMKQDGNTVEATVTVPATGRYTIYANSYVNNESISTMVECIDGYGIIVERAMYWNAYMDLDGDYAWMDWGGGHCSRGVTETSTTWYLAEGCTNGFDQYVLIQNPGDAEAECDVTFMKEDGSTVGLSVTVPATGRYTIYANDIVPDEAVSTMVDCTNDQEIIVERAMYWDDSGFSWVGGHCSVGVTEASTTWYLAEGCTDGFDEYVLVQNPGEIDAECEVTFMKEDGSTVVHDITVPATGRYTIHVNAVIPNESVSTKVECTNEQGVIVERAMYWNSDIDLSSGSDTLSIDWAGGHCSTGVIVTSPTWYLAEGCTDGFSEYVLIQNPNDSAVSCRATFMKQDGTTVTQDITVPATGRYTIFANDYVPNESVSTMVTCVDGTNIIVERAMYWNSDCYYYDAELGTSDYLGGGDWFGGHCSQGVTGTKN